VRQDVLCQPPTAENHNCPGLAEWDDPGGVFDSGFDGSVESGGAGGSGDGASAGVTDRVKQRIDRETSTGGIVSYFRGNATYALLAAMWITFLAQWAVTLLFGEAAHSQIFVLRSDAIGNVWTWVTSVLSHSRFGLFHIIGNSIVILFFGPLVERAVGSRRFVGFFFASGILAGLGHVLFAIATGAPTTGVLGASGAGFAILGVLTVWRPNMQVLLFFVIPMKIGTSRGDRAHLGGARRPKRHGRRRRHRAPRPPDRLRDRTRVRQAKREPRAVRGRSRRDADGRRERAGRSPRTGRARRAVLNGAPADLPQGHPDNIERPELLPDPSLSRAEMESLQRELAATATFADDHGSTRPWSRSTSPQT